MNSNDVIAAFEKIDLTENELSAVVGGYGALQEVDAYGSSGWYCTISGECNGGGGSCNPFPF